MIAGLYPGRTLRAAGILAVVSLIAIFAGVEAIAGQPTGVVAALGAVFFLWCTMQWRFGVVALVLVACIDGFLKLYRGSPAIYILKDATLACAIVGLLAALIVRREVVPQGVRWKALIPWCVFVGYILLLIFNPISPLSQSIAGAHNRIIFSFLVPMSVFFFDTPRRLLTTAYAAIAGVLFASLAGISQAIIPGTWASLSLGQLQNMNRWWYGFAAQAASAASNRVYGTLVDPGALGLACAYALMLGLVIQTTFKKPSSRVLGVLSLAVLAVALVLSGSRAGLYGTIAGILFIAVMLRRRPATRAFGMRIIVMSITMMVIAFAVRPSAVIRFFSSQGREYAQESRANDIGRVLDSAPTHPFGMGLNSSGAAGNVFDPNNDGNEVDDVYFAYLYTAGWLGPVLLIAFQGYLLIMTLRVHNRAESIDLRVVSLGIAGGQIALLVAGLATQGAFDQAPASQMFWLFSGAMLLPKRLLDGDHASAALQQRRSF